MNPALRGKATLATALLVLSGCSGGEETAKAPEGPGERVGPAPVVVSESGPPPADPPSEGHAGRWDLQSSGERVALVFRDPDEAAVRLVCLPRSNRIFVNVPAFRPIGSEERMTFGSGGAAHTLVADTRGDQRHGSVSGTGPVPRNLGALIGGPISINYGAQDSGPHPAPPRSLARAFLAGCGFPPPPSPPPSPPAAPSSAPKNEKVSACLMQGDKRLTNPPLRAVGTEPFWAAEVEGRCVTYSHPENQQGTRVWTKYSTRSGGGGTWTGALNGRPFVFTTRPQPGCSDGMSDRRYPLAVELTVGGEQRRGCAEPG